MSDSPDISKIINLIMANPELIEKISSLAKSSDSKESEPVEVQRQSIETTAIPERKSPKGEKRSKLLYAMKPYLSESRSKAIDSMLGIADIIDVIRGGDS